MCLCVGLCVCEGLCVCVKACVSAMRFNIVCVFSL